MLIDGLTNNKGGWLKVPFNTVILLPYFPPVLLPCFSVMYIKKLYTSDWLKTSAFSNSMRAAEIYIILSWLSVMFFHVYYLQVKTWFLVQFSIVSTFSMFQRLQLALALSSHAILLSSKNLFALIKTKWHPKSCYYLY